MSVLVSPETRNVLDALSAHVAVLDEHGVIVEVNQAWRRFALENAGEESRVGVGVNYLTVCQQSADVLGDENAALAREGIEAVLKGARSSFSLESPCPTSGEQLWYAMTVQPLAGGAHLVTPSPPVAPLRGAECENPSGAAAPRDASRLFPRGRGTLGAVVVHEKITKFGLSGELERQTAERKQAEEALRTKSQELERYFSTSLDLLCIADTEGHFLRLNPEWEKVLGYSIPELEGRPFLELVHPDDLEATMATMGQLAEQRTVLNFENRYRCRDGSYRWIEWRSVPHGNLIYAVARDTTERKRAEEALKQSEELFRNLFEGHSAVKLILNPDTADIMDANPAAAAFYGWSIEQLRHMHMHQISVLPPPMAAELEKAKPALKMRFESRHLRADGSIRDVEVFSTPIGTAARPMLYSIIHDITPRKEAEAERERLETLNRQLQKAESLGRMAGAVAHHLNNRLQAVMGNLEWAISELRTTAAPIESLTDALQSAHSAAEVSSLLLIYLGQTGAQREPLDLCEVCRRHLPAVQAVIPQSVVLSVNLPTPGPAIHADAGQIQQVLTNLLSNAWEANHDSSGSIRVTAKTASVANIPTRNRFPFDCRLQDADYACLEVADTGCGISDKDIEKIFDPYFSRKFTGRGMGLAVVLGIVRAHQGAIAVESHPEWGSVFRVYLPLSVEQRPL